MNRYVIALGSNQRHARFGNPAAILRAALAELAAQGVLVERVSPILRSRPLGPSQREYANGAALVETDLEPPELLDLLQSLEDAFGRRRQGQRWRARTLDLDIILWTGGGWADHRLTVPHAEFRKRDFVLRPAARIAYGWRDPLTGLTLNHLLSRLTRRASPPR